MWALASVGGEPWPRELYRCVLYRSKTCLTNWRRSSLGKVRSTPCVLCGAQAGNVIDPTAFEYQYGEKGACRSTLCSCGVIQVSLPKSVRGHHAERHVVSGHCVTAASSFNRTSNTAKVQKPFDWKDESRIRWPSVTQAIRHVSNNVPGYLINRE